MARLPRISPVGVPVHLIQRGNNRQTCFASDEDFGTYVGWLKEYSTKYAIDIHAWVLMTNHFHLLCQVDSPFRLSNTLRDLKRHTSIKLIKMIKEIPESRREWLLDKFSFEARRTGRAKYFKIWKDDNHAIWMPELDSRQKIVYIHDNPVKAMIVDLPESYLYSSARDYAGVKGKVHIEVMH